MTTANRSVLLIDDDCEIVEGASCRLRAKGYRTISAPDGQQGIEAARESQPDAIVLDVRMPRMDGLAALENLRHDERTQNIPIVMLSASLVDQQAALDAGARFFLTKPYEGRDLVTAVESAIDSGSIPV